MADRDVLVLDALPDVAPLLARAAARGVADKVARKPAGTTLPARTVVVLDHEQDAARLAAYDRVCGFTMTDAVPATWLHVLTFPLQTALMAAPDFPFPLAGLVHLANDLTLHRPVTLRDRLRLHVSADSLAEHRRGHRFDLVGEVYTGDELVWSGRSTYLARDGRPRPEGASAAADHARPDDRPALPPPGQLWRLPAGLGRAYAKVSGDVNPIHLNPLAARAFGFPRPLVHGMWTHARALAALGGRLPPTYGVEVSFTKPLLLPGTATFGVGPTASGWRFAVADRAGEKAYLLGEVHR